MKENELQKSTGNLFEKISSLIEQSRHTVKTTVNTAMVYTYYHVGQYIVEDEQQGNHRAEYGKGVLNDLSKRLTERFGDGWGYHSLRRFRQFYLVYSNLSNTVAQIQNSKHCLPNSEKLNSVDPIQSEKATHCIANSTPQDTPIIKASDIIKNPLTLEFLGLKPDSTYTESKLENAIISKMQQFLLELGKGFLFEARQKRFTFDEEHFYVDLVLYNRLLQCYVLVDLKTDRLSHQDLGQMQMYVNYYDRYVKQDFEKPTIGILLCERKNDALVELTLPKDANVYASAYQLYLPDKKLLQTKVKEWIEEFNEGKEDLND